MTPRYRLDGPPDAPVLVLPSSLGTTTGLWDANVEHWGTTFRLVRYDLDGRDSVEELGRDLVGLLDELAIGRASVCGLSLGGAAAMWAAANVPERIDGLVLACTSARFGEPRFWRERAALVRKQGLTPIADGIVARWFIPGERAEVVEQFRRMLVETPREAYAACCDALARWDFRGRLSELRASTLVIAGADDPATPAADADLLAAEIPLARLAVIPDASHLANVGQPEEFSRLVAGHLAAVEVA
jgi:3-oxoadipate enol-lactonase